MKTDDHGPWPAVAAGMIDVDVHGLHDFAHLLRTELDANFKPVSERIIMEHRAGVTFGEHNPSGEMQAARRLYGHCLSRAMPLEVATPAFLQGPSRGGRS